MTEVDTSSYPKPAAPQSIMAYAQGFQGIQQQQLAISQAKLDQANQGLTYLTRAFGSLPPDASKADYAKVGQDIVNMGLVPQSQLGIYNQRLQAASSPQAFREEILNAAATHQEQIQNYNGTPTAINNGAQIIPGVQGSAMRSGGFTPSGASVPTDLPPTTPNVNNQRLLPNGQPNPNYLQPGYKGPAAPVVAPARPGALPVASQNNVPAPAVRQPRTLSSLVTGPSGPTVQTGHNFDERFGAAYPNGSPVVASGAAPGVAGAIEQVGQQSGKDYASALSRSKNYQADLYPLQRVAEIIKEEGPQAFGPGTDQLTNLKSALVTWGGPNIDQKTIDSVSNLQQAKKYLVAAARASGSTGTNDQLAAAFEANPNTTMSGATIGTIVKSNIALRKMEQAQTLLFGQQNLPESEYSKWIAKNQNVLDPRAFGWDDMDDKAKAKLVDTLASRDKSGNLVAKKGKEKEFNKFEQSLSFANDASLIKPPGRN